MKEYFNKCEREKHIILMCMEYAIKEMQENNTSLTEYERECLDDITSAIQDFNESVFERFGDAYKRKIQGMLNCNNVQLVSKFTGAQKSAISYISNEDLTPLINDLTMFHCTECERTDHKTCPVYNIAVACDVFGENEEGCPYKWE